MLEPKELGRDGRLCGPAPLSPAILDWLASDSGPVWAFGIRARVEKSESMYQRTSVVSMEHLGLQLPAMNSLKQWQTSARMFQ